MRYARDVLTCFRCGAEFDKRDPATFQNVRAADVVALIGSGPEWLTGIADAEPIDLCARCALGTMDGDQNGAPSGSASSGATSSNRGTKSGNH